jgi:hypothetical protein
MMRVSWWWYIIAYAFVQRWHVLRAFGQSMSWTMALSMLGWEMNALMKLCVPVMTSKCAGSVVLAIPLRIP